MIRQALFLMLFGGACCGAVQAQTFLDLSAVTPGSVGVGAFSGTLGGVTVTGSIVAGPPASFSFTAVGAGIGNSTIDGSSPQYSHGAVFSPTAASTDRVGWSSLGTTTNVINIVFGSPITNPVFHVANVDLAQFSFIGTPGLTSMVLLKGNDGGGDGFDTAGFAFKWIQDAAPFTSDGTLPGAVPPVAGTRSAYGSVLLTGTFAGLVIGMGTNGPGTDVGGGSFTISLVPELPSTLLMGLGLAGLVGVRRWCSRGE